MSLISQKKFLNMFAKFFLTATSASRSISVFPKIFQAASVLDNIRSARRYMKRRLAAANSLAKRRKSGITSVVLPQSSVPLPGPEGHGAVQGRSAAETAKSPVVVVNTISVSRKSWA